MNTGNMRDFVLIAALFTSTIALSIIIDHENSSQTLVADRTTEELEVAMLRDPPLGTVAPLTATTPTSIGQTASLILFISECSDCSLHKLSTFANLELQGTITRYIASMKDVSLDISFKLPNSSKQFTVLKPHQLDTDALNPCFYPRLYAYDDNGRLVYIQHPATGLDRAMIDAVATLEKAHDDETAHLK